MTEDGAEHMTDNAVGRAGVHLARRSMRRVARAPGAADGDQRCWDRAATVVEYALLVALLAVALMSTIQFMEDRGEDRLEDRQENAGAPDVDALAPPSGGGGGGGAGGGGSGGEGGGGSTISPTATLTSSSSAQGNSWAASVTITVRDPANGNAGVPGVVVTGAWNPATSGQTSCTTNSSGSCNVTQGNMEARDNKSGYVSSVTFAVSGVSGDGVDYQEAPPTTPPIQIP